MRRTYATAIWILLAAGPAWPQDMKVKDYTVSVVKTERAAEWKDARFGPFAEAIRSMAGHELLLVTLRIEGAGTISIENFKAFGSDGQEYTSAFKSIEEKLLDDSPLLRAAQRPQENRRKWPRSPVCENCSRS
jgi:hypothetical protein